MKLAVTGLGVSTTALAIIVIACMPVSSKAAQNVSHSPKTGCVTMVLEGQPKVGMPYDEPVTFCGASLPNGQWTCPVSSPNVHPGEKLNCRKD